MTRILVTNDDGVAAPGIAALAVAARAAGHEVVVAAPMEEASGMSAALTAVVAEGRILMEKRDIGDFPAYGVAASPAYIVVLALLGLFGDPPDLVLSGINRGANAGPGVLHSATVGAALTAAVHGVRAMAVSLDVLDPASVAGRATDVAEASGGAAIRVRDDAVLHWTTAAAVAAGLLDEVAGLPAGTVLNLNVPDRPDVAEIRPATLAPFGQTRMAVAEAGDDFVRVTVHESGRQPEAGTDVGGLAEGYATVTVLRPPAESPGVVLPRQRVRPS